MKQALIVVQDFPPAAYGGGPVIRTAKFVKYLPDHGWRPIVLTLDPRHYLYQGLGTDLLAELPPSVVIQRTGAWRRRYTGEEHRAVRAAVAERFAQGGSPPGGWRGRLKAGARAVRDFLGRTLLTPGDEAYLWLLPALRAAARLRRDTPISLVYTTSPPHPVHLIGALLARRWGVPWVADFRDTWTTMPAFQAGWAARRWLDRRLERLVIRSATRVVVTTPAVQAELSALHGLPPAHFEVIPNGYDGASFEGPFERPERARFRIAYVGALGSGRNPRYFFQALRRWREAQPDLPSQIEVCFAGQMMPDDQALIFEMGVSDLVHNLGMLSHTEAIALMRGADLLLLFVFPDHQGTAIVSSKSYEYLAARRPILAMVPEGEGADLIRAAQAGLVVAPDDAEAIERALRAAYASWAAGAPWEVGAPEVAARYDRRALTGHLAQLFDHVSRDAKML